MMEVIVIQLKPLLLVPIKLSLFVIIKNQHNETTGCIKLPSSNTFPGKINKTNKKNRA